MMFQTPNFFRQIAFPGFGYWPRWYADNFRTWSSKLLEGHPSYANDTEQRNKNLCDVVHYLFKKYELLPDR